RSDPDVRPPFAAPVRPAAIPSPCQNRRRSAQEVFPQTAPHACSPEQTEALKPCTKPPVRLQRSQGNRRTVASYLSSQVLHFSGAPTDAHTLLPERTLRCRSEVNWRGRQILNVLSNDPQLAVGQLDEFRRSSVRRTTNLGWTEPGADGLSHTRLEILPRGAVPFQGVGGDHFQVPRHHRAAGFLHIHVKIRVRILPIESRQQPSEIRAPIFVELHGESVVRKPRRRCDNQTKSRNQNATKRASHR